MAQKVMETNTENNSINENNIENNLVENESNNERRQCWLCLGYEELFEETRNSWISPCRCSGTAKWIHNECLQLWIDEKQRNDNNINVKCSQCNTQYVLVFPPNGRLINIILSYEAILNKTASYAMIVCIAGAVYLSAFSYGVITCMQIMGTERVSDIIETSDKLLIIIGLPSIPLLLCVGKLIGWENMILKLWLKYYHKIPILSYLIGSPAEDNIRESVERNFLGRDNGIQIQRNNGVINHIEINVSGTSICRAFCGALLLPTIIAKIFGHIFYESIESDLQKTVLGGLTFILIKGSVKIYLRQQQFIRQTKRQILNFDESMAKTDNN